MKKVIPGTQISHINTMGSMYDGGYLLWVTFELDGVTVRGRITTGTIQQMVNEFKFKVRETDGRTKYPRLEDPELWGDVR